MIITAYIPLSKNAGIKLNRNLCFWNLYYCIFTIFWVSLLALFFSGVSMVSQCNPSNDSTTKTQIIWRRVSAVNSMFVGSSNELGAFESGVTKLMGTVTAVVFGGSMTLIIVAFTGIISLLEN
jgi:hypothetical protein